MPHEFKVLNPEQFLLTTLMVQLAIVATLATMLVRFRRFRRILLTERRDWPERLVFSVAVGIPLLVGVLSRLLLGYQAADLSLSGPFLAGLIAGPYAGALVGLMMGIPATVRRRIRRAPLLGRLRLRGRRSARGLPEGGDLAFFAIRLHRPPPLRVAFSATFPD